MARPFSLQTVLELMQTRSDEATQRLARLIAAERDAKEKFAMLLQYRDEYNSGKPYRMDWGNPNGAITRSS
ncbi:MAG: hypothetical protein V5B38_09200 [Candidatus Accumulibacter propinquus]